MMSYFFNVGLVDCSQRVNMPANASIGLLLSLIFIKIWANTGSYVLRSHMHGEGNVFTLAVCIFSAIHRIHDGILLRERVHSLLRGHMAEHTKASIFLLQISMLLQVMNTSWLYSESRDTVIDLNGQRVPRPCESFSDFSHSWVVLLLEREMCDF